MNCKSAFSHVILEKLSEAVRGAKDAAQTSVDEAILRWTHNHEEKLKGIFSNLNLFFTSYQIGNSLSLHFTD